MSTQPQPQQQQRMLTIAEDMTNMVAQTFAKAYALHAHLGLSLDAILIDYDIQAAGAGQLECVNHCAHSVIKAAVHAAQRNIPYDIACNYLMLRVVKTIRNILAEQQQ